VTAPASSLLPPALVARLARFRLTNRHRVAGRYAGAHRSRRLGESLEFADEREYVAGDDPRSIDLNASRRLGRLLVKLYEAEDEAALRVVVDLSASMGFGDKQTVTRQIAAAFAALAAGGQDRVRIFLVGGRRERPAGAGGTEPGEHARHDRIDAGPWFRGPSTLAAVEHRLLGTSAPTVAGDGDPPGRAHLAAALRQAHGEGPRGPAVLISDLLFDGWDSTLRTLAAGRGDALLVHVLGREDLDPTVRGDLRLVDVETGHTVEVGIDEAALEAHAATRDAWLADVAATCGRLGIGYARTVDDADVADLLLKDLRALGVVA
jgi:uncharacterized protein (DUF58 family)